jgi:hypothetical protein
MRIRTGCLLAFQILLATKASLGGQYRV